jgi:ribosomal protein S18 acetylase RimI-like enzyme
MCNGQAPHLRLRKALTGNPTPPQWPAGYAPAALDQIDAAKAHALLATAFPGQIAPVEDWYGNLVSDAEYDPALCIAAIETNGDVVGYIQCWTSNFIKDLAVAPDHRGNGIGAALMHHAFTLFAARGATHVDLKVKTGALPARRLYTRLGMVEIAD